MTCCRTSKSPLFPLFPAVLLAWVGTWGGTAFAGESGPARGSFCAPPDALLDQAESCAGNSTFVSAAKACLARLNTEEAAQGGRVGAVAGKAGYGQQQDTESARDGYTTSIDALARLQALAAEGERELREYEPFLALPSLEAAEIPGDAAAGTAPAMQVPCYAGAMKEVRAARAELHRKNAMYSQRRAEATASARTLSSRQGGYQALTAGASGHTRGRGGGRLFPGGASGRHRSQVTGNAEERSLK